ncbi:hypothetical protein CVT24_009096 [Panaeolus cyanescens]|uniref:WW domain-containing protein n=1 Tax=Panaeolus cyanescens TaxID=181874 RepID=A0A409VAP3_9AGAR|nr:hypothetical protein CVT24_009096 [Panaeolus cyanescens]
MSSAPPPYASTANPDTRTLPDGWITQFDPNYKAWYYVNTRSTPPETTWVHPLGPPPPPPQQYGPPSGPPPPNNNGYNPGFPQGNYGGYPNHNSQPPYGGYGGQNNYPYNSGPSPGGYGDQRDYGGYNQQSSYGSQPPANTKGAGGMLGGLMSKFGGGSSHGSGYPQQGGYNGYPPQTVVVQQQPKKSGGMGMGGMALAGGAGLLGGLLVADAIDDAFDGACFCPPTRHIALELSDMQNIARNPDSRPLPDGWSQHFEPSKRMWYYVQMNVMPPKVSFTHPADLMGGGGGTSSTPSPSSSLNALPQQGMRRPQSMSFQQGGLDASRTSGLTFAQKLYASSASNAHAVPMLNPADIHQNANKQHLPSPPSSSRGTSPLPVSPADFHPAAIPRPSGSRMSSMPTYGVSAMLPVAGSSGSTAAHHHPVRSTTFAAAQAFGQPNRLVTQQARPGFAPPRQTPHIVTTARPPQDSSASSSHPALNHAGGLPNSSSLSTSNTQGSHPLGGHTSPPPSSVLFSKPQPPPPPPLLSTQQPFGSMSPPPQINSPTSTISTITPENAHLHRPSTTIIQHNMVAVANTYNTIGPSPLGSDGPTFESRLIPSLRFALSRSGTRVSEADIQGVIQGQVNANYQGVVNALKQQQLGFQLQSDTPQIDYPALVVETQRLQIRAQAKQAEDLLAQQSNLQAQAYAQLSASLQAQQEAQAQALADRIQQQEMERLQQQQQMAAMQQQAQQALQAQQQQLAAQQQQQQQALAQQQQQLAQQQQAMNQQQQPQQSTLTTFLDIYSQFQQQSQQQTTVVDTTAQAPPSFDALYGSTTGGDPTAGGASFMDTFTQSLNASAGLMNAGGGGDPSGGVAGFLNNLNTTLASTDVSALGSTFDMASLGDSLGTFATE